LPTRGWWPTVLEIDRVRVRFGERVVLDDVSLTVSDGEIVGLLGPSGCGKSTLLRVIAGLQPIESGMVRWDGEDLVNVPAHARHFGLVFQDQQLFPHMDVAANVGFGLKMAHAAKRAIASRVGELLQLVGLPGHEGRSVATLSGGEGQRVALARALAPQPRLLLLDEPFSALDRELHDRLAVEVRNLLKQLGVTAIHVTHDPEEAAAVCDRVIRLAEPST
jgi:thiamine transport system ATP-binding protein